MIIQHDELPIGPYTLLPTETLAFVSLSGYYSISGWEVQTREETPRCAATPEVGSSPARQPQ